MLSHEMALRLTAAAEGSADGGGNGPCVIVMSCDPGTVDTKMVRAGESLGGDGAGDGAGSGGGGSSSLRRLARRSRELRPTP